MGCKGVSRRWLRARFNQLSKWALKRGQLSSWSATYHQIPNRILTTATLECAFPFIKASQASPGPMTLPRDLTSCRELGSNCAMILSQWVNLNDCYLRGYLPHFHGGSQRPLKACNLCHHGGLTSRLLDWILLGCFWMVAVVKRPHLGIPLRPCSALSGLWISNCHIPVVYFQGDLWGSVFWVKSKRVAFFSSRTCCAELDSLRFEWLFLVSFSFLETRSTVWLGYEVEVWRPSFGAMDIGQVVRATGCSFRLSALDFGNCWCCPRILRR